MRTPLPTWLRSWLWYLVSIGWSSPKKTKTAAIVRARGVRFSRSHSRRHRFIDCHVIDEVAVAISRSLGMDAGQEWAPVRARNADSRSAATGSQETWRAPQPAITAGIP